MTVASPGDGVGTERTGHFLDTVRATRPGSSPHGTVMRPVQPSEAREVLIVPRTVDPADSQLNQFA